MCEDIIEAIENLELYDSIDVEYVFLNRYRIKVQVRNIKVEFVYKYSKLCTFDFNIEEIVDIINSVIVSIEKRRCKKWK